MIKLLSAILLIFVSTFLSSCTGNYQHTLEFSPHEPLRVAVLPFKQIDKEGNIINDKGDLLVDDVPLISSEVNDSPVALSRKLVLAELKKTKLDIISPALIDIDLPHRNLAYPDGSFNLERIFSVPAKTYCSDFLDCDAVLFGTVRKWDRNYYGIQSDTEIELELKLISAKSEKTLFYSLGNDSDSRGLSKGPTGYSSLILEPLKGLDSELVEDLARRVISAMLKPLRLKSAVTTDNTPPPAIFAASHNAVNGKLQSKKPLLVLAFASPKTNASFSIGNYQRQIPMIERSPSHYVGEFWPLDGQSFDNQTIQISVKDSRGRETKLDVDSGVVSLGN